MLFRLRERLPGRRARHGRGGLKAGRDPAEALGARLLAEAALGDPHAPSTLRRALEVDAQCRHRRVMARPLFQVAFAWLWWDELERARTRSEPCARRRPSSATRASLAYVLVMGCPDRLVRGDVPSASATRTRATLTEQRARPRSARTCSRSSTRRRDRRRPRAGRERAERALAAPPARTADPPSTSRASPRPARAVGRPAGRGRARSAHWSTSCAPSGSSSRERRACPRPGRGADRAPRAGRGEELLAWFEGNAQRLDRTSWPPRPAAAGCSPAPAATSTDLRAAAGRRICTKVPIPLELAPHPLAYGSALRRTRQKAAARRGLEAAADGFDASRRAHVGGPSPRARPSRGRPPSSGALTPTERRVAELVAQGLQTKQVAARLFVSPKTWRATSRASTASSASAHAELARGSGASEVWTIKQD